MAARVACVMAMTAPSFTHAALSWIWSARSEADSIEIRSEFAVASAVRRGTLFVACDNRARVFLNGVEVLTNDDWSAPSRANVTSQLKVGANELRAEAGNQGGPAGFVARLRIRTADGSETTLETDSTWQARAAGQTEWQPAQVVGDYGDQPWGDPFGLGVGKPLVVQPADIRTLPGFRVELLYVVPKADQGSWVSMTVDPKGRIIACDQYGTLYRLTPTPAGSSEAPRVERLESAVGGAHGLLYAFDSLYVMVNEQGGKQGLWRLRDTDDDGRFDQEEHLRRIEGGGEHGPHAVVLGPDGKSLYVVCGNHTKQPDHLERSRAPRHWDEDQIIPRMWDANGHARGILAPGGTIYRTDPDGRVFELVSHGYRNAYDIAFNNLGDIITYDSDMEWDVGMPWYRPTRICLATSGSELGWRSGSGKWPAYYPDNLPGLLDIGPGSPTGLEAGRGARFPAGYQNAIFANDWTYGTMYAIHLAPDGAGYRAELEEFLSGKPLPLTDLVVNPVDGALYFAIGGRRTQSAVYRVSYTGRDSTAPAAAPQPTPEHRLRRQLESLHEEGTGPEAIGQAWPHLAHADRWVRYAARIAIERQPVERWAEAALEENRPWAVIESAIALAHSGAKRHRDAMLDALHRVDWVQLDPAARLGLLRAYQLVIMRLGAPEGASLERMITRLDARFPAGHKDLDRELANTLIALDAPIAVPKTLQLLATARDEDLAVGSGALLARNENYAKAFNQAASSRPNQQQLAYAYALRAAKSGWTPALRRAYFGWFPGTTPWQGGNSFRGFIANIRKDALANVADESERRALEELANRKAGVVNEDFPSPKGPGRDYTIEQVMAMGGNGLRGRNFEDGRNLFHSMQCFTCHRFAGGGGGLGPDLTASSSRFSLRDLLENIIEPSKVISDQYGSEQVRLTDGSILIGRTYEEEGRLHVVYDPRNPDEQESVVLSKVKSRQPYSVSFMPTGLLNPLNPDEVLNLLAYVQSGGDPNHPMFAR